MFRKPPTPPGAGERPSPERPRPDTRPLVARTSGSATEGVYGLILATSVIAISREYELSGAGSVALAVLGTAVVFWLAHVYAHVLGGGVSDEPTPFRTELAHALREHSSLVQVVVPLVLVLGLGAIDLVPDRAALTAATVVALVELAAAGGYAAATHGTGRRGVVASAAVALALGLAVVLLKALTH